MSIYHITRQEAWVITTLLQLPIQQGSALSEWLGIEPMPSMTEIEPWIPLAIETLEKKGYLPASNEKRSISVDLIESLMLAAVGQKHISTTLRLNEVGVGTRFLLAGSGIVQYGYEQDQIILHSPQQFEDLLQILLPTWLHIQPGEASGSTMPLGAFLLFKQACLERDIAFVLNANGSETFLNTNLEQSFARDSGWIDVFQALGVKGVSKFEEISFPAQLGYLLSLGYLERKNSSYLQIGSAGTKLAESLSDPDRVTITIGFNSLQPEKACTGVFLIAKNRLYRLDFVDESISIFQLRSRLEGLDWIRSLAGFPSSLQGLG
jgi:hypothetical protein